MNGKLETVSTILGFILAGNATFTIVSKKTGQRFTYKVVQREDNAPFFVSVLTGSDNENSYTYMGCIFQRNTFRTTRASKIGTTAPSYIAFNWFFGKMMAGIMSEDLEVWHSGKCGCCGRKLTTPESCSSGLGPVCSGKVAA